MVFPSYTTTKQKLWHYFYLFFCGFVLFFLVAPLVVVIPLSFTNSPYLQFIPEMKIKKDLYYNCKEDNQQLLYTNINKNNNSLVFLGDWLRHFSVTTLSEEGLWQGDYKEFIKLA